jgi:hypothetical protein
MTVLLGLNAKLYYSEDPITQDPYTPAGDPLVVWREQDNVKDLSRDGSTAEADITTRANSGFRQIAGTLKEFSLDFQMVYDPDNEAVVFFEGAWLANTEFAVADMDGSIVTADTKGIISNVRITNFSRTENLEEGVLIDVTVKASGFTQTYTV